LRYAAQLLVIAVPLLLGHSTATVLADEPDGDTRPELGRKLEAAMVEQGFPGAQVAVVRDGRVIYETALGLTARDGNDPVTPTTRFAIGSMGKQFTATAIMMLVEDGKLELDSTLGSLIPEVPEKYAAVTVHQMLSHLSGISRDFKKGHSLTGKKLYKAMAKSDPDFEPGTSFAYSNTNFILLGEIVERLSGISLDAFFAKHFFKPLEMSRTVCVTPDKPVDDRATGHETDSGPGNKFLPVRFGAGHILSTAGDVARWDIGLSAGSVLPVEVQEKMWDTEGPSGSFKDERGLETEVGYGWFVKTLDDERRLIQHSGSLDGFYGTIERYIDDGVTFIVLTNHEGGDVWAMISVLESEFLPVSATAFESDRVLENDLVTVAHTRYPAGAASEMHAHGDRVNVFLTDLAVHVTTGEGEEFEATREARTAVWSEATSHALRAISDFEVIVVELRGEGSALASVSPSDATRVAAQHHEIEFENDQVRIVRVKLPPGARPPSHVHSLPAVTVLLGDARIRVTDGEGQARVVDRHHGEVRWMDPAGQHTVENVGETELLAIRVEIKRAPA